jgi:hypothetical protein
VWVKRPKKSGGNRWMRECVGEGARGDYFPRKVGEAVRFVEREFATGNWARKDTA